MNKKLTAKVQELNPPAQQFATSFSKCLVVESESKDVQLRKGTIYSVFEVSGDANFDTALTERVLKDILYNSYFQSESISPIQCLEKAIVEAKEKVLQLSNDALSSEPQSIQFKIIASVLWGNVLYVVQFGEMDGFIMREGTTKPIGLLNEGNFSASSGIVYDEDVVILCSDQFNKSFPPQKLLATRISEQQLKENEACLLMKFLVDTSFSENEVVDFGLEKEAAKTRTREKTEKILFGARKALQKLAPAKRTVSKIFSSVNIPTIKAPSAKLQLNAKNKFMYVLPVLGALFIGAIVWQLTSKTENKKTNSISQPVQESTTSEQPAQPQVIVAETTKNDAQFKVQRVSPEVFYDVKIADSNAEPTEIVLASTYIVSNDPKTGKIFKSAANSAKFTPEITTYPGIKSMVNQGGKLTFLSNGKVITYDLAKSVETENFDLADTDLINTYSDYVYGISGDKLTRYAKSDDLLEPTLWGENEDFTDARSFTIAYSIYLISDNGNIGKYTSGNKNTFEIKGLDQPLTGASQIMADIDFENVYIMDPANQRIVLIDSEGKLVKQYKPQPSEKWEDMKSFAVSSDEDTLYFLAGSKIYQINLDK